jgi:hypothetical protein
MSATITFQYFLNLNRPQFTHQSYSQVQKVPREVNDVFKHFVGCIQFVTDCDLNNQGSTSGGSRHLSPRCHL